MAHPIKHFITITKHRHAVIKLCFKAGIPLRGLLHDLSKYSPSEFIPGAKYWQGDKSPQVVERKLLGYSAAWMHHKGRNKHHFEYWTDYLHGQGLCGIEMPKKYFAEMFCDRVAACKIYKGKNYKNSDALEYFNNTKSHYIMNENTMKQLERFLVMLAEQGEEETFKQLRLFIKDC